MQTSIHYPIPPHEQIAYKEYNALSLPLTERIHAEVLSIPMNSVLSENDVTYVIRAINSFKAE